MRIEKALVVFIFLIFLAVSFHSLGQNNPSQSLSASYEDLIRLFREWREFQKPEVFAGVPDYSAAAMKKQKEGLKVFEQRLEAIDCRAWPVSQQIDYHLVRAEMNGLEFDHRVLRPWSRDPCFYSVITDSEPDVPKREGPEIYGVFNIWEYRLPLSEKEIAEFRAKLQAISLVLEQAKKNLKEEAGDLWLLGIRMKERESTILANLAKRLAEYHPDLVSYAQQAKAAVDKFRGWLEEKEKQVKAPSGIGIENFNWYMKNVHLVPYTWKEQLNIVQREWERAMAALKFEEHQNRRLPLLELPTTEEELIRRYNEAVDLFMEFLKKEEIFTVPDYMHLDFFKGRFIPPGGIRDFFTQVEYRDSLPMKCHSIHWLDKQRMAQNPHPSPIRSLPLLYNIWDSRAEGLATGMEEMMMQAGLFKDRPRDRELVYILIAMRAARAMADLKMHSGEFTLEEAIRFAVDRTPYGWLRKDGNTVWTDMMIYLHQPGYGTSYLIGKIHIEKLLAERSRQLARKFSLRRFMDEFFASGMIPVSLIRWEMTGLDDEIKSLLE